MDSQQSTLGQNCFEVKDMLDLAEGPLLTSHPKACDLVGNRVVAPEPGALGILGSPGSPGSPWGWIRFFELTPLRSEKELEAQCGGFDQWRCLGCFQALDSMA